jgi:FixJ family two-component response regulator
MSSPTTPVIHIVDDDTSMREALARLLGAHGFKVSQYASAGDFLLAWPVAEPGCLLLDVRMPGPSGLDLQLALAQRSDSPPVIFLTGFGDIPMSVMAIQRGAVDFLTKPVDQAALLAAVQAALRRDAQRRAENQRHREVQESFASLTTRERAVFAQVAEGRLNKQIAASLSTCERTVKAHRAHVMQKMHASSVAELVHLAIELEPQVSGGDALPA